MRPLNRNIKEKEKLVKMVYIVGCTVHLSTHLRAIK